MLIKTLLLSVLISITSAQNCSKSDVMQTICIQKFENYRGIMEYVKYKLDIFYEQIEDQPLGLTSRQVLEQNRTKYERQISNFLDKLESNIETLKMINNLQRRRKMCVKYQITSGKEIEKLSKSMKLFQSQLSKELHNSALPWKKIHMYEKPITIAASVSSFLDLFVRGIKNLGRAFVWMKDSYISLTSTNALATAQKGIVDELEVTIKEVIKAEFEGLSAEQEAAAERYINAAVQHLRTGSQALGEAEEAESAMVLEAEATAEAAELSEAAALPGATEDTVIAARAAQAARAEQVLRAAQATRSAQETRAIEAGRIVENADAAEAMTTDITSIGSTVAEDVAIAGGVGIAAGATALSTGTAAAGTADAAAIGSTGIAEGIVVLDAETAIAAGVGAAGAVFSGVACVALFVLFAVDLANEAIEYAHEKYQIYHVDEKTIELIKTIGNLLIAGARSAEELVEVIKKGGNGK